MERSTPAAAEFICLGFQRAVGADSKIVIGQESIDYGNIVSELRLAPIQLQALNLFMGIIAMGKTSVRLTRKAARQDQDKGQSPHRRQPTMLGMSAHKRIGC
jgi:hypothetical protein